MKRVHNGIQWPKREKEISDVGENDGIKYKLLIQRVTTYKRGLWNSCFGKEQIGIEVGLPDKRDLINKCGEPKFAYFAVDNLPHTFLI